MENLIKIQSELKVPKTNVNSFGKYKYRSAEDILEAVKPLLAKYNVALILTDTIELIGTRLFCKATATLKDKDLDVIVEGWAELAEHKGMSAEQATGTASSYSRKYALNGLFLIDETASDADSQPSDNRETLTDERFSKAIIAIAEGKATKESLIQNFKLTEKQLQQL